MKIYRCFINHPLGLIITVALLIRILPASVRFVIGSDDSLFLTLGQNLAAGHGYTGDGLTTQIDFPPAYPLFAAAIYTLGGGLEWPTKLNMLLIGSLLPVSIYGLASQLTNSKTALIAALLTALHPALVLSQGNFESVAEQPYALLLYTGWGMLWLALTRRQLWHFGLAGLLIGIAHWVRWEGLILGLIAAGLLVLLLRREALWPVLAFLLGLALFALPYGLFLYQHTGSPLSPKTMLTQLHAAAIDATSSDPYAFERAFFDDYELWLADPHQVPHVVATSRTAAWQRYGRNVLFEIRLWFTSLSFLTWLWFIPFVIGLVTMGRKHTLFLLPLFIPLLVIPASVIDPRYFLIPLPISMIFVAQGWTWLIERLPHLKLSGLSRPVAFGQLLLGLTLSLFIVASLSGPFLYPRPLGYRAAGLALRSQIVPGTHIFARKRQIPFYAGGVWEWLPFADLDEVLNQAKTRNVDYLVIDQFTTPALRPQLAYLLDPTNAPETLTPIYIGPAADVIIYHIAGIK